MLKHELELPDEYKKELEKAVNLLKKEGCEEIYIFGSLAKDNLNNTSDIDLAVKGCPSGKFFSILGKLMLELNVSVDLINLDKEDNFAKFLKEEGELINVGYENN